jgi:hypothetical protein
LKKENEITKTRHPLVDKANKLILLGKYNFIKANVLAIASEDAFIHTEQKEEIFKKVKYYFKGSIQ